ATLDDSVARHLDGYQVQIIGDRSRRDPYDPYTVRVIEGGVVACSFPAHDETVFTRRGDVLHVARVCPLPTGCPVAAYDLKSWERLWECSLRGIGPIGHSEYRNQVNITTDGDAVVVYGKESNGRYIEYVDAKEGKTIGHKKLPPEH